MKKILSLMLFSVACFFLAGKLDLLPVSYSKSIPAVLETPVQSPLNGTNTIPYRNGKITFLANYDITARVMSAKSYSFDPESRISPIDFALGWGNMSAPGIYNLLKIKQGGRFYTYRWGSGGPPIPQSDIIRNSANVHLVPANDQIEKQLKRVNKGQIVTIKGKLISYRESNWNWTSSMSRTDSGAGACELIYVESIDIY